MATTLGKTSAADAFAVRGAADARTRAAAIPWYLYAVALAAISVVVGVIWDISWHQTIGRDTFWTPAHMCTYFAALVVGIACGYVALRTTFAGTPDERAQAIAVPAFQRCARARRCGQHIPCS